TTLPLVADGSGAVRYSTGWPGHRSATALRGTYHSSATPGSTATLTFTGRAIGIVAIVGPGSGGLDVRIDGHLVRQVALDGSGRARRVIFVAGLGPGMHTIDV